MRGLSPHFSTMKKRHLISLLCFSLFMGCGEKTAHQSFRLDEKKLTVSNTFFSNKWNYLLDSKGQEILSFADLVTAKKITFHSMDSKISWSVDLKGLMKSTKERFIDYFPVSTDSIVLLSGGTNRIYLINRKAEILTKIDQSNLLLEGMEFGPPIYFEKDQLYYAMHHYPLIDLKTKNDLKVWDAEYLRKPIIAKTPVNFQGESPVQFGEKLLSRFNKDNALPAEGTYFYLNQSKMYYYSSYNDTLYSLTENRNIPLLKVKSRIGKIHVTVSTREQYNQNTDCINENFLKQSCISDVLHDNHRNLVYVIVRKPKVDDDFPFNLLVYDQNLKKLDEIEFDGKNHDPGGFTGKKGLYIERKTDKNSKQKSFDLFVYENH